MLVCKNPSRKHEEKFFPLKTFPFLVAKFIAVFCEKKPISSGLFQTEDAGLVMHGLIWGFLQ